MPVRVEPVAASSAWEPQLARHGRGPLRTHLTRGLFLLALVFIVSIGVSAQTAESDSTAVERVDETTLLLDGSATSPDSPAVSISPFGIWDLLRMILVLAAVVGVVYGIFFLLKKGGRGKFAQNDNIQILGNQSLPGNRNMYLVKVGAQVFLVGSAGDSVNLISEITDKESVDEAILTAGRNGTGPRKSFGEMVAGIFKGGESQSLGLMREQRQRLQRLRQQ